jgi:hypothetical protein
LAGTRTGLRAGSITGYPLKMLFMRLAKRLLRTSLRRFRTPGWKRLQCWNYGRFGLAAAHCFF